MNETVKVLNINQYDQQIKGSKGWIYLTYNQTQLQSLSPTYLRFTLGSKSTVDPIVSYARKNDIPTEVTYDYAGSLQHISQFILPSPLSSNSGWIIGVQSSEDFYVWIGCKLIYLNLKK